RQGIDSRDFALVAFGGAGPLHAAWLARELGIAEIVVPASPGTFSAWGMLQADVRRDLTRGFYRPIAGADAAVLGDAFQALEREGLAARAAEQVPAGDVYFVRSADVRYVGQEYTVEVPVGPQPRPDALARDFHAAHRTRYGHATPDAPAELV